MRLAKGIEYDHRSYGCQTKRTTQFSPHPRFSRHTDQETPPPTQLPSTSWVSTGTTQLYSGPTTASLSLPTATLSPTPMAPPPTPVTLSKLPQWWTRIAHQLFRFCLSLKPQIKLFNNTPLGMFRQEGGGGGEERKKEAKPSRG